MLTDLGFQCDQTRPACLQCTRANRACPGYRDELSLLFRDETQDVVRKAKETRLSKAASHLSKKKRTSCSFENGANSDKRVILRPATAVESQRYNYDCDPLRLRWISAPITEQATNFFFANFAWLAASLMQKGVLFAPNLDDSLGGKALMAGVASIGSATLSNIHNAPEFHVSARENYIAALRLIKGALADTSQAKTDLTFTASILLGIFEVRYIPRIYFPESYIEDSLSLARILPQQITGLATSEALWHSSSYEAPAGLRMNQECACSIS